jgi:hypothetical protein
MAAASAQAVYLTLLRTDVISPESVRATMRMLSDETFFGILRFNNFHRNVGDDAFTLQVSVCG